MMNSTVKVRMERSVRRIMTLKASAYMLYNIAARRRQAELFNELVRAKLVLEDYFSHTSMIWSFCQSYYSHVESEVEAE
jgi:hypothetical protein